MNIIEKLSNIKVVISALIIAGVILLVATQLFSTMLTIESVHVNDINSTIEAIEGVM